MLVSYNPYLAIVFTNTKKKADEVADGLLEKGLKVGRIHGDLSPRERKKMMKQIHDLEYQYIVATDLLQGESILKALAILSTMNYQLI